ncbi:hypothetical protein L2D08_03540 [Domibacillus sp. PGB-M46]|uniref:hypothetical protein n=1 Tax=Domibacillus sp. PGB-M46 TaxID=2910255 RepID=UPI001F57DA32|nr:hypothetical protein [Domibacillus sp. PGB-M46]MCI2253434.1 hypothetical protein [Domibacillus sp. PGB-M46]
MNKLIFKRAEEIDRSQILKADSYQELVSKMESRLKRKYSSSKIKWVRQVQMVFSDWDKDTDEVYSELQKLLKFTIEAKAKYYEKKYKSVRLSYHDFEAELWKITFAAIQYYEESGDIDTEFMLVETLEMFWKTRMIDFIKSCLYTEKHSPWYKAATLDEKSIERLPDNSPSMEQQYIYKETIEEMFNAEELTEKERELLALIYDNPSGSLREWGSELGVPHPQTVRRLFDSLKNKLVKYNIF